MMRYVLAGVLSGMLFGVMDGIIHANPFARKLYSYYGPLAKTSINPVAGVIVDLLYGFVMAAVFLLLFKALPGASSLAKGICFGAMVWFFRVVMSVAGDWVMLNVPPAALLYRLASGLAEMLVLGCLYGLTLSRDYL